MDLLIARSVSAQIFTLLNTDRALQLRHLLSLPNLIKHGTSTDLCGHAHGTSVAKANPSHAGQCMER
jgi:hypothetical protein